MFRSSSDSWPDYVVNAFQMRIFLYCSQQQITADIGGESVPVESLPPSHTWECLLQQENQAPKSRLSKHKRSFNFGTKAESNGSVETLEDDQHSALLLTEKSRAKKKSLTTVLVVLEDFGDVAGVDEAEELLEGRRWDSAGDSGTLDPHRGEEGEEEVCAVDTHSQQDLQS